jgi:hypothetical protein
MFWQSIIVIPRKNRLRIYVDVQDKYYRLRDLKRSLSEVIVKVIVIAVLCGHVGRNSTSA